MAIKAEILQTILSEGDKAKAIPGKPHVYTPEEYNKVMAKKRALGLINDGQSDGYYHSRVEEGEVEFDEFGNLKKLGRTQPKMLDLNRYCANRYSIDRISVAQTKARGLEAGTYLVCVFGEAIVRAINATTELPATIKAFRFKRNTVKSTITQETYDNMVPEDQATCKVGDEFETVVWDYVKSEFVPKEDVYKMTKKLSNLGALELMQKVEEARADSSMDNVDGDDLDGIL